MPELFDSLSSASSSTLTSMASPRIMGMATGCSSRSVVDFSSREMSVEDDRSFAPVLSSSSLQ